MKTPVHLWIIGVVTLIWNGGGAYDYVMTQTGNAAYLSMLTEAQRAYFDAVPAWYVAAWAIGVWFSVAGSVLLLARSRFAAPAFALSLLGLLVAAVYSYILSDPSAMDVVGPFALAFSVAIGIVIALSWYYARRMIARGVLR